MKITVRKSDPYYRDIRVEIDTIRIDLGLFNLAQCEDLAKQLIEAAGDLMPNSYSTEGTRELRKLIDNIYGAEDE